jgi:hypothetical protein
MAKKERIRLQFSDDLEAIDADLAAAMESLDAKNVQVNELLRSFDPPTPPPAQEEGAQANPAAQAEAAEAAKGAEDNPPPAAP